jgi:hypothetical protein
MNITRRAEAVTPVKHDPLLCGLDFLDGRQLCDACEADRQAREAARLALIATAGQHADRHCGQLGRLASLVSEWPPAARPGVTLSHQAQRNGLLRRIARAIRQGVRGG